ncbi:hypothetical protein H6F61_20175 [Cyanobacteria bacterium FACHB-472]|nr:hypothetical protein [Cyanobacteria bacterium FACHB-472]
MAKILVLVEAVWLPDDRVPSGDSGEENDPRLEKACFFTANKGEQNGSQKRSKRCIAGRFSGKRI